MDALPPEDVIEALASVQYPADLEEKAARKNTPPPTVTDIMNLVKDLKQSLADGKVDKNEAAKIATDVAEVMAELATLIPLVLKFAPKV